MIPLGKFVSPGRQPRSRHELNDQLDARREAEQALRLRTAQLETLVNAAPLGVYLVNADFRITQVNPIALRVFNYIPDLIGRDFDEVIHRVWPEADADEIVRIFRHTLETGESSSIPEPVKQRLIRGVTEWYEWQLHSIQLQDGRAGVVCYVRDISFEVQFREALSETEARYRQVVNSLPGAVYTIDAEGRITLYNQAASALWGRSPSIGQDRWCGSQRIFYPDGTPMLLDACPMAVTIREGRAVRGQEIIIERPDGTRRHVLPYPEPIRDQSGAIVGAVNMLVDITEAKHVEAALRDSEAFNRGILSSLSANIVVLDRQGIIVAANESWNVFAAGNGAGHLASVGIGRRYLDACREGSSDDASIRRIVEGIEAVYKGVQPSFTMEYPCHSPTEQRWFLMRATPLRNGEGLVISHENVTELKRAEETLREREERLRLVMQAGEMGAWDIDLLTNETRWDVREHELCGVPLQGVKPSPELFYSLVHPEDAPGLKATVADTIARSGSFNREFRIVLADGTIRWLAGKGFAVRDAEGQAVRLLGVNFDITPRKIAEEDLTRLAVDLEQRVQERTEELERSQDQLRAFATKLNLAEQRERKRLATELHDHLAQMLVLGKMKLGQSKGLTKSGQRHDTLIAETDGVLSDALTYIRTLVSDLTPPILYEFGLPEALTWLGEQMRRHALTVTVHIEAEPPMLPEDQAVLLFQCVRELLLNAAKYAKSGHAAVRMERRSGYLCIEVRDEGAGFDPAVLRGQHLDAALPSKFGLFSIRQRMKALGGLFDFYSAPGEGTRAILALPLGVRMSAHSKGEVLGSDEERPESGVLSDEGRKRESKTQHAGLPQQNAKIRVLLVDDHAMVRQGLRSVLESYPDVEVVGEALNGEDAIAAAEALQPSLVVMDINMPRMNGIEATAQIKARNPDIIVIGLSVNAGGSNEEAMEQAGAAMLLTKEAAVDELYRAIQTTLHGTI